MTKDDQSLMAERDKSILMESAAAHELHRTIRFTPPVWIVRQVVRGAAPNAGILSKMAKGYEASLENRTTTEDMFKMMRVGFSITRGRSNKIFKTAISRNVPKEEIDVSHSMFQVENAERVVEDAVASLEKFAFWKAPFLAPRGIVESLRAKVWGGLEAEYGERVQDAVNGVTGAPAQLKSRSSWLMTFEEMFQLSADPLLLSVVQSYLGVPPIFDIPVAFLNSSVKLSNEVEYSKAAQLYHHDMERLAFVKLFIYLTDVDLGSGPHTLLPGTHKRRPARLWGLGRYSDETIARNGLLSTEVKITGEAGTIFLVDTSTLHKGTHPEAKSRLMAQVQYSNSLFGYRATSQDPKVTLSQSSKDANTLESADIVRKYAARAGVRFMQRYI
jgi:hypothetical protein